MVNRTIESNDNSPVMNVKETAAYLRIGLNQTYAGIRNGEIPSFLIGKRILISRAALEKKFDSEGDWCDEEISKI